MSTDLPHAANRRSGLLLVALAASGRTTSPRWPRSFAALPA